MRRKRGAATSPRGVAAGRNNAAGCSGGNNTKMASVTMQPLSFAQQAAQNVSLSAKRECSTRRTPTQVLVLPFL